MSKNVNQFSVADKQAVGEVALTNVSDATLLTRGVAAGLADAEAVQGAIDDVVALIDDLPGGAGATTETLIERGTVRLYDLYNVSASTATAIPFSITDGVLTKGTLYTGSQSNNSPGLQAYIDLCQGDVCKISNRSDAMGWRLNSQPYDAGTTYATGNVVYDRGTLFESKSNGNIAHRPPNSTYWTRLDMRQPWWLASPLYYQHDTEYDLYGTEFRPTDGFMGTQFAAYNALLTTYVRGSKASYNNRNYICLKTLAAGVTPGSDLTAWWQCENGYLWEPDNRDSGYVEEQSSGTDAFTSSDPFAGEYRTDRYTGSNITIRGLRGDGRRDGLSGYDIKPWLDTSRRIGLLLINQSTNADTIDDDNDTSASAVDSYIKVRDLTAFHFSGPAFYARGRGECQYTNVQIKACQFGFIHNQYDTKCHHFHIGDCTYNALMVLRQLSADNEYVDFKDWYSGRLAQKAVYIGSNVIDTHRRDVLGEPTLPDDPTTLLFSYGTPGDGQTQLTRFEKYQRESAYVAGVTGIVATTATWTSGADEGQGDVPSPYSAVRGIHDGVDATAGGQLIVSSNPAVGETLKVLETTLTFVASGATGNQINIGANTTLTAANIATKLNSSHVTFMVDAVASTNTVTLTSRVPGAAGNAVTCNPKSGSSASTNVLSKDLAGSTVITKLRGGIGLPVFSPPSADAAANPTGPDGVTSFTGDFWGYDYYVEGANCRFVACASQDAHAENWYIIGKRLKFIACTATQGSARPKKQYNQKAAVKIRATSRFSGSGTELQFIGFDVKDNSDLPATSYGFEFQGAVSGVEIESTISTTLRGSSNSGKWNKVSGATLTNVRGKFALNDAFATMS